jgi:hypothetical protein
MTEKLPILATLQEAGRLVVQNRGDLLRVGIVFIIGFFAVGAIVWSYLLPLLAGASLDGSGPKSIDPRLPMGLLLTGVIEFLLFAVFAVGWHRVILLGIHRAGSGLGVQLGGRELRYFGRLWICFLGSIAIATVFTFVEQLIGAAVAASPENFIIAAEISYILASAYVFCRIGPTFAALSVDLPFSFSQAWRATRGNGFRLVAIYLLAAAGWLLVSLFFGLIAGALGLSDAAPYTLILINAVALAGMFALLVTINAIVFRRLSGWKGPV